MKLVFLRSARRHRRVLALALVVPWLSLAEGGAQFISTNPGVRRVLNAEPSSTAPLGVGDSPTTPDSSAEPTARWVRDHRDRVNDSATAHTTRVGLAPPSAADRRFRDAFQKLRRQAGDSLELYLRRETGTPRQIKGAILHRALAGPDPGALGRGERTARAFLRVHRGLLGLEDPDQESILIHVGTDALGWTRWRFAQRWQGVEVWPCEWSVHLDALDNVVLFEGAYVRTPSEVKRVPRIAPEEAVARATVSLAERAPPNVQTTSPLGPAPEFTPPRLIIYAPLDGRPRLAWRFEFAEDLSHHWRIVVDAEDGAVLTRVNLCHGAGGVGTGADLFGVPRTFGVTETNGVYFLVNQSKPMFDAPTGNGTITVGDANNATMQSLTGRNPFQDFPIVTSLNTGAWNNPDAVSAAHGLSEIYDYYRERFGRNSYNDQGGNLLALVRIRDNPAGAGWHPVFNLMMVGNDDSYAGSLDVMGHEVTHGVIGSVGGAGGVLGVENQSGALDEAFADIFGEMIEARTVGQADWIIGSKLKEPLRNLAQPSSLLYLSLRYPSKMTEYRPLPNDEAGDHGGVHLNCTIIGHAYYLLAEGLTGAIGLRDAEQIFFRCLTRHLARQSEFIDARLGCVAAAEELFGPGSAQVLKTMEAFDAVELFAAPASPDTSVVRVPAVSAEDSTLFVYADPDTGGFSLGRWEAAQGDKAPGTKLVPDVKLARPSVAGDGTLAVFVDSLNGLSMVNTRTIDADASLPGRIHSLVISPDATWLAVVYNDTAGNPGNQITLLSLETDDALAFKLVTPVAAGLPLDNVLSAGSLDFSPDGGWIVYDALCTAYWSDGSSREAWTIFALDRKTRSIKVLVAATTALDFRNPTFAKTSTRFITYEAQDANGHSQIMTMDLITGRTAVVGIAAGGLAYPVFNGDDTAIVYADDDARSYSGRSLFRQPLGENRLSTKGSRTLWLSGPSLGVIYRRGQYTGGNAAPKVFLSSPPRTALFSSPARIVIQANASDADGQVRKVEFYVGDKWLGEVKAAPFQFIWTNVTAGNYQVLARAVDDLGSTATSSPANVAVSPGPSPGQAGGRLDGPAGGFELSLKAPRAGVYRVEVSTNLVDWTGLGTCLGIAGQVNFTDRSGTGNGGRFYRAVKTP